MVRTGLAGRTNNINMANKNKTINRARSISDTNIQAPPAYVTKQERRSRRHQTPGRPEESSACGMQPSATCASQKTLTPELKYIEFTRGDVSRRARQLWIASRSPIEQQCQFWLEAELEIISAALAVLRELKVNLKSGHSVSSSKRRAKSNPKLRIVR